MRRLMTRERLSPMLLALAMFAAPSASARAESEPAKDLEPSAEKISAPSAVERGNQPFARANSGDSERRPGATPQPAIPTSLWQSLVDGLPTTEGEIVPPLASAQPYPPNRRPVDLAPEMPTFNPKGYIRARDGYFTLVQAEAPPQPLQGITPAPSSPLQPTQPLGALPTFGQGGIASGLESLPADRAQQAATVAPVMGATSDRALAVNAQPDLAESISKEVLAVQTQFRSAISESPFIRGFKNRQIYAQLNGQYFEPVRWDLDTIVSNIDPGIVQDVIVVQGPYAVQYGPGFTFMDIVTRPTPRNQPVQYRSSASWIMNGQQWYGRETLSGGTQNLAYRFSYGHRNANNYEAGNNIQVPSHYNRGDVLAELGYNLSGYQRIEATYRRFDENHTAYPGQFWDVSSLQTNSYNLRYIDTDPVKPWTQLTAQGWYNNNSLTGNTFDTTKQGVVQNVERSLTNFYFFDQRANAPDQPIYAGFSGGTAGNIQSTGGRLVALFGELDEVSLNTGLDTRVINQRVSEFFTLDQFGLPMPGGAPGVSAVSPVPLNIDQFTTGMPRATMVNPGAFAEMTLPWTSYFRTKIGGRGDFVNTNANPATLPLNTGSLPMTGLSQSDGLYAFYMVNQLNLSQHWMASFSFGQAQRAPTLIDRYADGMFLGILQSGYRRVIGDPSLRKERNWQIDASINGNYDKWRGYLRGYQSWVLDYITYSANSARDPTGAVLLNTLNTPLAELRGFEAFNSFDLTPRITPFASARYVYGMDQTIHQPLTQIPPLQGFAGLRFHDPNEGRVWGMEFFATITRKQNRAGVIRVTDVPVNAATGAGLTQIEVPTPGWTTWNLRGYWNVKRNLLISGGINNMFNKSYIQHLSLRTYPTAVFSPGFSPYLATEYVY